MRSTLTGLAKGLANVLMTLAFFYLVYWWFFVHKPEQTRRAENPVYAAELFENRLPVAQVLASRKWHPRGPRIWECTYAIVRLDDGAPASPPSWRDEERGWQYDFGGAWAPTPEPPLKDNTRRALMFCAKYWPDVAPALAELLHEPGHWIDRDRIGETLYLYSQSRRLAALIRYGD